MMKWRCKLCFSEAHIADDGNWRHAKEPWEDASMLCDKYGYPIPVERADKEDVDSIREWAESARQTLVNKVSDSFHKYAAALTCMVSSASQETMFLPNAAELIVSHHEAALAAREEWVAAKRELDKFDRRLATIKVHHDSEGT